METNGNRCILAVTKSSFMLKSSLKSQEVSSTDMFTTETRRAEGLLPFKAWLTDWLIAASCGSSLALSLSTLQYTVCWFDRS